MKFKRWALRKVGTEEVLLSMGDSITKMGVPSPGDKGQSPILFHNRRDAHTVRKIRLGPPKEFEIIPVLITIGD